MPVPQPKSLPLLILCAVLALAAPCLIACSQRKA
jgi:hypothetical protein